MPQTEGRRVLGESERRRRVMQLGVFLLALVLFTLPLASQAQQSGKVARLGLLGLFTPELGSRRVAVREGLDDLGWHESQNIQFEPRYASGAARSVWSAGGRARPAESRRHRHVRDGCNPRGERGNGEYSDRDGRRRRSGGLRIRDGPRAARGGERDRGLAAANRL